MSAPERLSRDELIEALEVADLPVMLMVLVHLTGDRRWIEPPFTPQRDSHVFAAEDGGLDPAAQEAIRAAALELLSGPFDPAGAEVDDALLAEMMSVCVGEPVGPDYVEMLAEQIRLRPRSAAQPPAPDLAAELDVVVIGAGLAGVGMAIELERLGVPFTVLEQESHPGGTWYRNTYPGCGVDTPNHFYSFSFDPPADWSSYFSKQPEVLGYIERTIERHGIGPRIRCGVEVLTASWDQEAQRWSTTIEVDGERQVISSRVLVSAVGHLSFPKIPAIEGIEDFGGEIFHTAQWRDDVDLAGRDVAVVGTGASAMQAAPTIAGTAGSLTIYQRSPQWVMPIPEYERAVPEAKRRLLNEVPFYAAWYRFSLFWRYADGLHRTLFVDPEWPHPERSINRRNERHRTDMTAFIEGELEGRPDLLEKCIPSYPPYGKRMLVDAGWFATLKRPGVELVADGIARFTPTGIEAEDGSERPCEVAIMATGFETTRLIHPIEVRGREGITLDEFWQGDELGAYLGMAVPSFPNFFIMLGPHSGLAHGGSAIFQVECQARYIGRCIAAMLERGIGTIECRLDRYADYEARVDEAHSRMVFSHPGMNNWYKNSRGRVVVPSPWRLVDYWWMTRDLDLGDYATEPLRGAGVAT